jgi:hypothetical protein
VSPVSDWNWMITFAGSGSGGSSRAILAGGSPLPLAIPCCLMCFLVVTQQSSGGLEVSCYGRSAWAATYTTLGMKV